MILLISACTPDPGAAEGTLVNARSGTPVADAEITLTPDSGACVPTTTRTDAQGRWSVAGLCGEARWQVDVAGDWELEPVPAATGLRLDAWPAPPQDGVYLLDHDTLAPLLTHTALDRLRTPGGTEVSFPVEIPGSVPRLDGDRTLLVAGDVLPDPLVLLPLVPCATAVTLRNGDADRVVDPWVYLGRTCEADFAAESPAVSARPIGPAAGRRLRYLGGDAAPPGRYALATRDGNRAFLLDFGPATP